MNESVSFLSSASGKACSFALSVRIRVCGSNLAFIKTVGSTANFCHEISLGL